MHPVTRRRLDGDRGSVAVLFALFLVLLFGAGTLAVDIGSVYSEGRQLQNGAENAAVAVARSCAPPATACQPGLATTFADANANDTMAAVDTVCGTAPGLPACAPTTQRVRFDCTAASGAAPYVQVRTSTSGTGGVQVPTTFARGLNPPPAGLTVRACARAAYGAPLGLTSQIPLTISFCQWNAATGGGTTFASPPFTPTSPNHQVIFIKGNTSAGTCTGPAGAALPGGFGWLDSTGCQATTTSVDGSDVVQSDPGAAGPSTCDISSYLGQSLFVPVYEAASGTGAGATYKVGGYGAFVMTAYQFNGSNRARLPGYPWPCTVPQGQCISGFFTAAVAPTTGTIGGPSMGATIIQVTG